MDFEVARFDCCSKIFYEGARSIFFFLQDYFFQDLRSSYDICLSVSGKLKPVQAYCNDLNPREPGERDFKYFLVEISRTSGCSPDEHDLLSEKYSGPHKRRPDFVLKLISIESITSPEALGLHGKEILKPVRQRVTTRDEISTAYACLTLSLPSSKTTFSATLKRNV